MIQKKRHSKDKEEKKEIEKNRTSEKIELFYLFPRSVTHLKNKINDSVISIVSFLFRHERSKLILEQSKYDDSF